MSSVPRPSKITFDRLGNKHLLCVEAKTINIVTTRLEALKYLPENLKILQWGEAKNVNSFLDIEQFDLIANLESRLVEILDRATIGIRFYAIGSEQFVGNLCRYARSFGLCEEEIGFEVVDRETKDIYCSNCQTTNLSVRDSVFICSHCGIKLEVLEHFSQLKNAYLGICADAEALEKASEVK